MATTNAFDPVSAGLRVSDSPIRRKARRPSSRPAPKPRYADAVWYSFQHGDPLETEVPTQAVEDTVRQLKRAARYLERTHSTAGSKVEVRVQISVEALPDVGKTKRSVIKFLGHEPWLLGRRISKEMSGDAQAPRPAGQHRRTTAATRDSLRKTALPGAVAGSVITLAVVLMP